jgi:hypothetical protein
MRADDPFQHIDQNDVLEFGPRHKRPVTDDLVAQIFHRTTGGGRSALLPRSEVARLHAWLGQWLEQGWDGVTRKCGAVYRRDGLHCWVCDQPPDGHSWHEGPATIWAAGEAEPHPRASWSDDDEGASRAGI